MCVDGALSVWARLLYAVARVASLGASFERQMFTPEQLVAAAAAATTAYTCQG